MVQVKAQNTYAQLGNYLMWFTRLRGRPETGSSKEIDETGINRKEEAS